MKYLYRFVDELLVSSVHSSTSARHTSHVYYVAWAREDRTHSYLRNGIQFEPNSFDELLSIASPSLYVCSSILQLAHKLSCTFDSYRHQYFTRKNNRTVSTSTNYGDSGI